MSGFTRRQAGSLLAGGAVLAVGTAACGSGDPGFRALMDADGDPQVGGPGQGPGQQPRGAPTPDLAVSIHPAANASGISPIEPIVVRATGGALQAVTMTSPQGKQVRGALSGDRTEWRSAEPLGYGRTYQLSATANGPDGKTTTETSTFTTVTPAQVAFPSFFPPPKTRTVGVAQPLIVIFDRAVPDKAAAERALKVETSPAIQGAWSWFDDRTVHWRAPKYYAPGTKVRLRAQVYGVHLGGGIYGETDRELNLTIGPARIAVVDDRTKQMVITVNGRRVLTAPVSMGRPGSVTVNGKRISFVTQSGIHVVQEKYQVKRMSSSSYGLPSDSSLGYDSQIPLAVRISQSGEFVHSAPWSVADQGVRNVSHGCVNMPPDKAKWFYENFTFGDVVDIRNTGATMAPTNGYGDWNMPWEQWLRGSALR